MPDVGGKEFYSALHKQAIAEVENIFKSVLYPVQFPAQGDFHPEWHDLNDVFNKATLGYIDALVSPGDFPGTVKLSAPNGFLNAYVQVIAAIDFTLSEHDTHVVTKAEGNARASAGILISDYQEKFKTITQKQMDDAGVANKQDYISYIIGNIWSGTEAANKSPLTAKIMAEARDLMDLLPALPSSGDLVVTDYLTYLGDMSPAVTQQTRQALGRYFLRSLKRNSGSPNLDNGGMKTVDPEQNTISDGYEPKYEINKSPAAIYGELTDKDRKITLSMEISQASGSDSSVSVEGQAGFSIGSWLSFGVEGGASYDMSKAQGTSMDCTVLMEFEGYSMFPTVPLAWDQATNVGWYYDQPIAEAVKNADKDVTGFKFLGTPPDYNWDSIDKSGDFGIISNLLITSLPTITITYKKADYATFAKHWSQEAKGGLTLFGFIHLGGKESAYGSSFKQDASSEGFSVTFSAPDSRVAALDHTAYVIGVGIANPGAAPVTQSLVETLMA